jgi:hypothetical protein
MTPQEAVAELKSSEEFFERSSRCLTEEDSAFRPTPDMYTVAQQVAHAARTIDWFVEGAVRPEGFDMDFERHVAEIMVVVPYEGEGLGCEVVRSSAASLRVANRGGFGETSPRRSGYGRSARVWGYLCNRGAHGSPSWRTHCILASSRENTVDAVLRITGDAR